MEGNIFINGEIGENVHLVDIVKQVQGQPFATMFNVHINSIGGSVDVGFDIYNYLKSLNVPITTIGSGVVASIATVIFMAGNERKLRKNTEFMIHLPSGSVSGTSSDIEAYSEMIKKYDKKLIDFYVESTGLQREAIEPFLKNETWLSIDDAFDFKFVTEMEVDFPLVAKAVYNLKPDNKMTEEQKGLFTKFNDKLDSIIDKLVGKSNVKSILLQDANGVEIDFPDVMEGEQPIVGESTAMVDGSPAEGEYLMPDGTTMIFVGGILTEIKEAEVDDSAERIAELERQLAEANAKVEAKDSQIEEITNEVKAMKKEIKSTFKAEPVVAKKQEEQTTSDAKSALENLKQKRRK
jgi:ATP-dependent Clp endopeptidase proteolytic subunit ClpP